MQFSPISFCPMLLDFPPPRACNFCITYTPESCDSPTLTCAVMDRATPISISSLAPGIKRCPLMEPLAPFSNQRRHQRTVGWRGSSNLQRRLLFISNSSITQITSNKTSIISMSILHIMILTMYCRKEEKNIGFYQIS